MTGRAMCQSKMSQIEKILRATSRVQKTLVEANTLEHQIKEKSMFEPTLQLSQVTNYGYSTYGTMDQQWSTCTKAVTRSIADLRRASCVDYAYVQCRHFSPPIEVSQHAQLLYATRLLVKDTTRRYKVLRRFYSFG